MQIFIEIQERQINLDFLASRMRTLYRMLSIFHCATLVAALTWDYKGRPDSDKKKENQVNLNDEI